MSRETRDTEIFWDFRFCGSVAPFQCKFNLQKYLHFLQKYRCVPKIGFSADISIDVSIDIFIDMLIEAFIYISIDILIDISIDMLTDTFIDMLTDKEEGGGGKGRKGVDHSLKSNNPTPTGGEKANFPELIPSKKS